MRRGTELFFCPFSITQPDRESSAKQLRPHLPAGGDAVVTFVGQFKNLAQREAWALGVIGPFWQASFWDHFLRRDEDLRRVIDYVLENPVRAGLVSVRQDYPFSGLPFVDG